MLLVDLPAAKLVSNSHESSQGWARMYAHMHLGPTGYNRQ
jgi:hypothetical protein